MSEPMVWLPFDPAALGEPPAGLRLARVSPDGRSLPPGAGDVEVFVPAYDWDVDLSVLAELPRLRVVQTLTAGYEHVLPHLPDGVVLCNGRGIHETSTSELALALILASLRGIPDFVRAQHRGDWVYAPRPALADRRVLIVGYGAIGAAVEARLRPFEVDIERVAGRPRDGVHGVTELPGLLPEADVVVLVVPLTEQTRGLVDAAFLARMKPGALLVNVARGAVVDTDALLASVRSGHITAALDVTDPEPLPPDHPLWSTPGVLISPHVGGASSAMWPRAYRVVREQLVRYAAGEPLANVVSPT